MNFSTELLQTHGLPAAHAQSLIYNYVAQHKRLSKTTYGFNYFKMWKGKVKMDEYYENTGILTCRLSCKSDDKNGLQYYWHKCHDVILICLKVH